MNKKIIASLTCALLLLCILPATALAAAGDSGTTGDYVWKELSDGTYMITGYTGSETGTLTIPDTLNGKAVTMIENSVFPNRTMTGLVVPEGVTSIGNGTFTGCASLASVSLPGTLTYIGASCFNSCTSLTSITLPGSLEKIGSQAFFGDSKLATVTMQNGAACVIESNAFGNCSQLNSVTLSDTLVSIGNSAFTGCSILTSITIPGSVQTIGEQAFSSCPLTSVTLKRGIVTIGKTAFLTTQITEIVIPDTVETIGEVAFAGCTKLTKVVVLNSAASFGPNAFGGVTCGIYGFADSTANTYATTSGEGTFTFHTIYKVTYDSNGGSDVDWGYAESGGTTTAPANPTKKFSSSGPDFAFGGWYADEALTDKWDFAADTVGADITLYAKWFFYVPMHDSYIDESEFFQLGTFLNSASAAAGYTNGCFMNAGYTLTNLSSWPSITWAGYNEDGITVNHVKSIDWSEGGSQLNGELDLSNFQYLDTFILSGSRIDGLKVAGDTALKELCCEGAYLKDGKGNVINAGPVSLDVSDCTALENLFVSMNSLAALDVSHNAALLWLDCSDNKIPALNLTNNTKLNSVACGNNSLTSLDTSAAAENLIELLCDHNNLTSLNISGNSGLTSFSCNDNALTALSVAGSKLLSSFHCENNRIASSFDLTNYTALKYLYCGNNQIPGITLAGCKALETLSCEDNRISSLGIGDSTALKLLNCGGNNLNALNISSNTALTSLVCRGNRIASLNVINNTALKRMDCSNCGLTALPVSANTALTDLYCSANSLGTIDVSHNTALRNLNCGNCGLSALDLSNNTVLTGLGCSGNNLTGLDLSKQTQPFALLCSGNRLTSLDIRHLPVLILDCTDNPMTSVKASISCSPDNKPVELKANGEGYVGLYVYLIEEEDKPEPELYALAAPKTGAAFTGWTDASNASVANTAKYALTYGNEYNLTANFIKQYTITAVSGNSAYGAVTGGGTYAAGATVTLTAAANPGFRFTGWYSGGTLVSSSATYTFAVSADITLTAQFVADPINYTITAESANPVYGAVTGGGTYAAGATVTLTAAANPGFRFTGWYSGGALVSSSATYTFAASANITLTAEFAANPVNYTITAVSGSPAYGAVTGGGTYTSGASVTLKATAKSGYSFAGWYKGTVCNANTLVSTKAIYTFTASADGAYTAQFGRVGIPATITATAASYNGIVVKWAAVPGAKGYQVYRATSPNGAYTRIAMNSATRCTCANLKTGVTYYFKVRAYTGNGSKRIYGYYSVMVSATPTLSGVSGARASVSTPTAVKLTWKAVSGSTKYEVWRSVTPNGAYKLVKTTSARSYVNMGVAPGTAYYYKIRAVRAAGGVKAYGAYSGVVSAKPELKQVTGMKAAKAGAKQIRLTWKAVKGATRYEVWAAASSGGTYTLLGESPSRLYLHKGAAAGATYYYKVRAYCKVGGVKYYGAFSNVVSATPKK